MNAAKVFRTASALVAPATQRAAATAAGEGGRKVRLAKRWHFPFALSGGREREREALAKVLETYRLCIFHERWTKPKINPGAQKKSRRSWTIHGSGHICLCVHLLHCQAYLLLDKTICKTMSNQTFVLGSFHSSSGSCLLPSWLLDTEAWLWWATADPCTESSTALQGSRQHDRIIKRKVSRKKSVKVSSN